MSSKIVSFNNKGFIPEINEPVLVSVNKINEQITNIPLCQTKLNTLKPQTTVVKLDDIYYSYGKEKVLNGINMSVSGGTIYGLLGANGCGKTTSLRLIIGLLKPSSGNVTVLGHTPGSKSSIVPGPGVGYMPQELALYNYLTIYEILYYYSNLNQIDHNTVHHKIMELVTLLQLPDGLRLISSLSGNQKRSTSLAVALLHEAPLLILDEPTVGVDPILRQTIWDHLRDLSTNNGQTIIITTHYIEEAKCSDRVGLMRNGKLLIEEHPEVILQKTQLESLEHAFLQLSQQSELNNNMDVDEKPLNNNNNNNNTDNAKDASYSNDIKTNDELKSLSRLSSRDISSGKLSALIWKNVTTLKHNIRHLLIQFLFPALILFIISLCIGKDISNVPVAVFNSDSSSIASDLVLKHIDTEFINLNYFDTKMEAIRAVKDGKMWAVISFPINYTQTITQLALFQCNYKNKDENNEELDVKSIETKDDDDDGSEGKMNQVELLLDNTSQLFSMTIKREIYAALKRAAENSRDIFKLNTDGPTNSLAPPIKVNNPPIYGVKNGRMRDFFAPGFILSIVFTLSMVLTSMVLIIERKEGHLERTLASGVKVHQFIFSHLFTQFFINIIQIIIILFCARILLNVKFQGSYLLTFSLIALQGFCGMTYGLLMSALCKHTYVALIMSNATFFLLMALSGGIWPIEALPQWIKYISYAMPMTIPLDAIRSVLYRGWDLSYTMIQMGFAVNIIWNIILLSLAIFLFKKKFVIIIGYL